MRIAIFILSASLAWSQFPVNSKGWVITGLPAAQDNLLGPLIPSGNSPWIFSDLAERGTAQNMAPIASSYAPVLGTALPGTVSGTQGSNTFTTTSDLRTPLSGQVWVVFAWNSIDGAGTGRTLCPINFVTSSTIVCAENEYMPTFSGVTAYLMPPPDSHGIDFQSWTTENPVTGWNYYDVAIGLYRLYYRTGVTAWQTYARQYADITWQWTIDHGYRFLSPRGASMISQFFRASDGHPERLPYLYNWINLEIPFWASASSCPACDNREGGYMLWDIALGAKVDTDPTRHAQYCTWLGTYAPQWNGAQAADGSWPEKPANVMVFASAPKTFTAPFQYGGAPWREAINVKSMEAAYESLNDTSSQGCAARSLILHDFKVGPTPIPQWIHDNKAFMEATPFDGMTVYMRNPDLSNNMTATVFSNTPTSEATIASVLSPMAGIAFTHLTQNMAFVFINTLPPDVFDDWSVIVQNFANLAQALKAAGLRGVFFDNEQYVAWGCYPGCVSYSGTHTLAQYQAQTTLRGKQIMQAMVAQFPGIVVFTLHGPETSEPSSPVVNGGDLYFPGNELLGPLFVGFMEGGSATAATVIDGGELYCLRTPSDFQTVYTWNKNTMPTVASFIPVPDRAGWPAQISISYGLYDALNCNGSGGLTTPTIMQQIVTNSMSRADQYAWLYTENTTFLLPPGSGGASSAMVAAVANGKAAAAPLGPSTLSVETLTAITNAVSWQYNYGRSTVNRGIFYTVNSQSNDQLTVTGAGTMSVNLTSTAVTGSGTNWNTAGYCDGTHFIGIQAANNVYKIASCSDNTHATLSVAFGLYGEVSNVSGSAFSIAPAASTSCGGSLATYCYLGAANGDRNLTRTLPGGIGWLYAQTLNSAYKTWADEFVSSNLGGPTAGLTSAADTGSFVLPCSGPGCDGLVTDTVAAAANCGLTIPANTPPCVYGVDVYASQGKNYGEAFGAPGLDNELAWRLSATGGTSTGGKVTFGGSLLQQ